MRCHEADRAKKNFDRQVAKLIVCIQVPLDFVTNWRLFIDEKLSAKNHGPFVRARLPQYHAAHLLYLSLTGFEPIYPLTTTDPAKLTVLFVLASSTRQPRFLLICRK